MAKWNKLPKLGFGLQPGRSSIPSSCPAHPATGICPVHSAAARCGYQQALTSPAGRRTRTSDPSVPHVFISAGIRPHSDKVAPGPSPENRRSRPGAVRLINSPSKRSQFHRADPSTKRILNAPQPPYTNRFFPRPSQRFIPTCVVRHLAGQAPKEFWQRISNHRTPNSCQFSSFNPRLIPKSQHQSWRKIRVPSSAWPASWPSSPSRALPTPR